MEIAVTLVATVIVLTVLGIAYSNRQSARTTTTTSTTTTRTGTGPVRSAQSRTYVEREGLDVEEVIDTALTVAHIADELSGDDYDDSIPEEAPAVAVEERTGLEISEEESRRVSGDTVETRTTGLEISDSESRRVADIAPVRESFTPSYSEPSTDRSSSFGGGSSDSGYSGGGGGGDFGGGD